MTVRRPVGHSGQCLPTIFVPPPNFVVPRYIYFKHIIKTKAFPLKKQFPPKYSSLATGLAVRMEEFGEEIFYLLSTAL